MITRAKAPESATRSLRGMVHELLGLRQQLLVVFCRLAGVDWPYGGGRHPVHEHLREFCQLLVDYVALGHFELLAQAVRLEELDAGLRARIEEVYPRIAASSKQAVAFNDKYDAQVEPFPAADLEGDLSVLGEQLAARIELEDRVIALLEGL